MTAEIIRIDFKKREVICRETHTPVSNTVDVAANKRLINDLKAMLDSVVEQIDLSTAIMLIPGQPDDCFVKIDGTDMTAQDIQAAERVVTKMRRSNVQG